MISVIGAVNVDVTASSNSKFIPSDSNPGKVKITVGGVGRNIACNLSKLSQNVNFFTVFGNDDFSTVAKANCVNSGLDISRALTCESNSSYYICVTDEIGEMRAAVADMDIVSSISPKYIEKELSLINSSEVVVIDMNLDETTIEYIIDNVKAPIFADAVSCKKALKLNSIFKNGKKLNLHLLKANELEAEIISGIKIENNDDIEKVVKSIHSMGVELVCITRGIKGSCIYDGKELTTVEAKPIKPVNATGAGDSFLAALVYSFVNNYDKKTSLEIGSAVSEITLYSTESVNPDLNEKTILQKVGLYNE
ncbi:MAG: carbohydrate kinase family protein [Clostridia bacterium]|nr:carbohydrate kinase family protein [Clostridia bacterium]